MAQIHALGRLQQTDNDLRRQWLNRQQRTECFFFHLSPLYPSKHESGIYRGPVRIVA